MPTRKFKDWDINESISLSQADEVAKDLYEIPLIKKWEEHRAKTLQFHGSRYTINILRGFKVHGYVNGLKMSFNLPRTFINKVKELEKYAHCHIAPDVVSDRLYITLIDDTKLKNYGRDSDVVRTFKDNRDMELEVRFNTNAKSEVRKIFEESINFIMDDFRDSHYIFNADIRKIPKLNIIMKEQVNETYQNMLDDLSKGDLDAIENNYKFDANTIAAMLGRAIDDDPSLEDQINSLPDEAKDIWFATLGGKEFKATKNLSKLLKSLKIVNAMKMI
jgi:hypothetical protein